MTPLREAARRALHEWKTDPGSVRMASLMMALQDALAYHKETDDLELAMMQGMDKGRELEREACARVCDECGDELWKIYRQGDLKNPTARGSDYVQGAADQSLTLAAAIRARGKR